MNLNQLKRLVREEVRRAMARKIMERKEMGTYGYYTHINEELRGEFPEWFEKNEIERRVNELVVDNYDKFNDRVYIALPLVDGVIACAVKEPGQSPDCMIYDLGTESAKQLHFPDILDFYAYCVEHGRELYLPNVCAFIENVVQKCVDEMGGYTNRYLRRWGKGSDNRMKGETR